MGTTAKVVNRQFDPARPFEIRVKRLRDNEVALEVWQYTLNGRARGAEKPRKVARVAGLPLHATWDHLMFALRRAGLRASDLSPARRKRRLWLPEEVGVRVALLGAAVAPLRKLERIQSLAGSISAMSYEEACYWYAHARSEHGRRALRALRILLAAR